MPAAEHGPVHHLLQFADLYWNTSDVLFLGVDSNYTTPKEVIPGIKPGSFDFIVSPTRKTTSTLIACNQGKLWAIQAFRTIESRSRPPSWPSKHRTSGLQCNRNDQLEDSSRVSSSTRSSILPSRDESRLSMLEKLIKGVCRELGYDVRRIVPSTDLLRSRIQIPLPPRPSRRPSIYSIWSAPYPLYTPWVGHPDFMVYYHDVNNSTMFPLIVATCLTSLDMHCCWTETLPSAVFAGRTALAPGALAPRRSRERHLIPFR